MAKMPNELTKIKAILMDLAGEIEGLRQTGDMSFKRDPWFKEIFKAINEIKDV